MKDRLEAEIATVKELIREANEVNDILGVNSLESRLNALELEYNTLYELDKCWDSKGNAHILDRDAYNALLCESDNSSDNAEKQERIQNPLNLYGL